MRVACDPHFFIYSGNHFFDSIHAMRSYDPAQNNNANDDPLLDCRQAK